MRNRIRAAKHFINAYRVEVRRLAFLHINGGQKEAKALPARINGGDQRNRYQSPETGVFGHDLGRLEAFLEGAGFVN